MRDAGLDQSTPNVPLPTADAGGEGLTNWGMVMATSNERPWSATSGPFWFEFEPEPRPRGTLVVLRSSRAPVLVRGRQRYVEWRGTDEILRAPMTEIPAKRLRRTLKDIEKDDVTALMKWLREMSRKHRMHVVQQQSEQPVDATCIWSRLLELVEGGAS